MPAPEPPEAPALVHVPTPTHDLIHIIADVTDLPVPAVTPGSRFADLGGWSSLVALRLLTAVEQHFGISLDLRAYLDVETVGELSAMVAELTVA